MRRLILVVSILTLMALACNVGAEIDPTDTPSATDAPLPTDRPPDPTSPVTGSEHRCGDGVCDGPENAENCPQDCAEGGTDLTPAPPIEGVDARPGPEPGTYWVTNPTSGVELFTTVMLPEGDSQSLPALVIIPGGDDDSAGITEGGIGQMAVEQGYAVVAFDADGRGRSAGEENYNGFTHQDGLAAVIRFAADLSAVDTNRMGLMSFSYGVTMASGTLARYSDLPICFLIDWEGPADRFDTTVGCKPSPHYDWPACEDDQAWAEREALTFISQVQVPYQRVQTEEDHVQPDVSHAVHMVNAAVDGPSSWVRLNDNPPNQSYDPDAPPTMFPERGGPPLDEVMLRYAREMFELVENVS